MQQKKSWIKYLVIFAAACGLCIFTPTITMTSVVSHGSKDFRDQCDSAIGPDPSATAATTSTQPVEPAEPAAAPSALPSSNPYAAMTIAPQARDVPDRFRACVDAMQAAPYQVPGSLRTENFGVAVSCAQQLAFDYSQSGTGDAAVLARDVIYAASSASFSGLCTPMAAPAGSDTVPGGCGDPSGPRRAVLLPETVDRQGYCGQKVVVAAITAGDLIFWDYRDNAATRVGIAVSAGEMVTGNPGVGRFFRIAIPESENLRVKRVLGGEL